MASHRTLIVSGCLTLLVACSDDGGNGDDIGTLDGGDVDPTDSTETGTGETGTTDTGDTGEELRPNWHQDVAPLVTSACAGCHTEGGIAPFSMDGYQQTSPWAALMADDAEQGLMPPWHAIPSNDCAPPLAFKHDPRLSAEEIQLLRDWADIGAPEGDPNLAAPLPEPPDLDLPNPTTTALMASPVSVEAQGNTLDFFHCLSLDPGNAEEVYIDGLQVVAGNRSVLHHVLVYIDTTADSASWPGGVKLDCGGAAGTNAPTELVSAWVPGGLPMEPPAGVGITLPAGARIILNVHYHATGGGAEIDDGTGMALRWTNNKPAYGSLFELIGAPGEGNSLNGPLMIPAGETNHVEEYEWTVSYNGQAFPDSIDVRVWAAINHMHKVGVSAEAWIESAQDGTSCLLATPKWDFNWQRFYEYDAPVNQAIRVRAGDTIRVRCTYDNSLNNPGVVEALAEVGLDQPIDVNLGEATLDEMCLTGIAVGVNGL